MSAKETRINDKPISAVPEVAAFEEVKGRLKAFKEANTDFFEYLDAITEEYNSKLEVADKAVRACASSCGDFHLYQTQQKVDAEVLYQSLGQARFLEVGGTMTTRTFYAVDKIRFNSALKANQISEDVVAVAVKNEPRFHKPEKISL